MASPLRTLMITTLIGSSSLATYLPDQRGGTSVVLAERRDMECCAIGYPELINLHY